MKKSPLRRKSKQPIRKLIKLADRQLQDFYRLKYKGKLCEVCEENLFEVCHHFIPKSQSSKLRYDERNLAFICQKCHFRLHRAGDSRVTATIIKKRGLDWYNAIEGLSREYLDINKRSFLEGIIKQHELPKES